MGEDIYKTILLCMGLISKIYKHLKQFNNKKFKTQLKNEQKT